MDISVERAVPNEYDYFVRVGVGGDQRTIITTTAPKRLRCQRLDSMLTEKELVCDETWTF
ncbi:hypothetical protein PanWU01x14_055720 [Parasponia andersonii]|uniref:Uncharacterized protein n=1 Tax=Parasponia andersonii TaxID=3476 RepID=A0A2P5DK52_PARAD|nr:hypothetical protein PanWU01x14_055720 [Parasponia andersonii]